MAYKVMVDTDDGGEYSTGTLYDTVEEAEAEADEIMSDGPKYIDDSAITGAWVIKED